MRSWSQHRSHSCRKWTGEINYETSNNLTNRSTPTSTLEVLMQAVVRTCSQYKSVTRQQENLPVEQKNQETYAEIHLFHQRRRFPDHQHADC